MTGRETERPAYRLYRWAWAGLDWLYPPACAGCDRPGSRWCPACQAGASLVAGHLCPRCGQTQAAARLCARCAAAGPGLSAIRSWAYFEGPLRSALHRLKYKGDVALGEALARPVIQLAAGLDWPVDLVTAVPAGVARSAERGYNQAALLAWPLALALGWAYRPQALARSRETRSQVGLTAEQRQRNVTGAFAAQPGLVAGKTVLVVDDVATSGATLEACAGALLAAGAGPVYALTLARARPPHPGSNWPEYV